MGILELIRDALPEAIGGLIVAAIVAFIGYLYTRWRKTITKPVESETGPPSLSKPPVPKIPHNLPQPGEFIGREREKAELREALASRSYLVCIDGIGGIGKTALALEAAHECLRVSNGEIPADGVPVFDAFVWTTAKDRELVLSDILDSIARTLDYPYIAQLPPEEKPSEAAKLLRAHRSLLIVDNFETITDDAVRHFLLNLPEPSKALITSREQKLRQARAISLRGMEKDEALTLIRSEGKRLGLPAVEQAEEKVLLRLYEATGGAPLAIKWAVGQMKQRGQSLDTVLDYLYEARGDIFENIFSRSWELLSENARRVLMVMPIFATSASKAAIEAASDVHKWDLDEALGQLVEIWLVEASEELDEAKRRYSIHPLTRAFAGARLRENAEWEREARRRAAKYFLAFTRRYGGIEWKKFESLKMEHENILAVMDWCLEAEEWRAFVELEAAMRYVLSFGGDWQELIKRGLQATEASVRIGDKATYAWAALNSLSWTYRKRGDFAKASRWANEAHKYFEELGDKRGTAASFHNLGSIAESEGKLDEARGFYQQCITVCGEPADREAGYDALVDLGDIARKQGSYEEARRLYEERLRVWQKLNDPMWVAILLGKLGLVAYHSDDYETAWRLYEEDLEGNQKLGRQNGIAYSKRALAHIGVLLGKDRAQMQTLAQEALEIFERLGMKLEYEETRELVARLERPLVGDGQRTQALVARLEGKLSADR